MKIKTDVKYVHDRSIHQIVARVEELIYRWKSGLETDGELAVLIAKEAVAACELELWNEQHEVEVH